MNRRQFLALTGASSVAAFTGLTESRLRAANAVLSEKSYRVTDVSRTTVKLEYREVPRRNMDRELPHWRWTEICEVTLASGNVGIGETLLYYTWGVPGEDDVARVIGQNAMSVMWDDSLGAGLQMALFDAVARTAEVPVHYLLGNQVYERTPLSWWNIDTSAADMASECATAFEQGYMSYKTKGRQWFDIHEQVAQAAAAVPEDFKIDMDFNDTLLTAEQGIPILKDLERTPQIDIYETPIPQDDVAGNRAICEATRVNVAMHYGTPDPATVVRESACDGFVVGHGATELMAAGRFAGEVGMPFWLQLVGSGVTAAWSLHFGGVLNQAVWPAVNCHQLYEQDLLVEPIHVADGTAAVPETPGLGVELNRDLVQKLKVPRPERRPEPPRLIETTWADGQRMYTASNGQVNFMLTAGQQGKYPYYKQGADTRLVPDDGTARWRELYERARREGPIEG
mgnify:CR=1 FL=1